MASMLVVNPAKKTRRKKGRSPAQRAATRRLVAGNKKRKRRPNPAPPGSVRKRGRRRNPRARVFTQRNLTDYAFAATVGAAGAITLDVVLSYLPLPPMFKTGIPGKIAKGAAAVAMGAVANATGLVKAGTARDMAVGALTVQFTGIGRDLLAQFAPGIALSAYMNEDYAATMPNLGYAGSGWDPSRSLSWGNSGMSAYNVGEGYDISAPGHGQPGLEMYEEGEYWGMN